MRHIPQAAMHITEDGKPLKPLDVDWEALEIGARDGSDVTQSYLDTETGDVLVVVKGEPDEKMLKDKIRASRSRFKKVPAFGLAEERSLLREFLSHQTQGNGRELLMRLVDEPGAFHACLTALKADRTLWKEWNRFEATGLQGSLLGWMASLGVKPVVMMSSYSEE